MNILVSINRSYVRYFSVALYSLTKHTGANLRVFVMHDDLSEYDRAEILAAFPEIRFEFIFMNRELCLGFPTVKRYPYTVYYRIFAPLFLPMDVDRVLYLDSDLVIHNSPDVLYDTPFGDNLFVACTHTGCALKLLNRIRLGCGKDAVYMNTGVLLMNVSKLREVLNAEKIREFTVKNKWRLMLYDQDILYKFFGEMVKEEDSAVYNFSDRELKRNNAFGKKKIDAEWIEKNNVIIHYIGRNKPWRSDYRGVLGGYYTDAEKEFLSETRGQI